MQRAQARAMGMLGEAESEKRRKIYRRAVRTRCRVLAALARLRRAAAGGDGKPRGVLGARRTTRGARKVRFECGIDRSGRCPRGRNWEVARCWLGCPCEELEWVLIGVLMGAELG